MSGFRVQPAALTAFANTLCAAGAGESDAGPEGLDYEFLVEAQEYADRWVKLKGGSGGLIFSHIVGAADSLRAQLEANYSAIGELLVSSADGLNASAARYRSQDHATAEHLDTVYKPTGVAPVSDNVNVSAAHIDPLTVLTEPTEDGAVPDMVQFILDAVGYFSETEIVLKILDVLGFNVEDWVKKIFVGDYKALARCRNALLNLSRFDDAAATTIAEDNTRMMKSWQGSAAAAAQVYFNQLAGDIGRHANALSSLAQKLDALVGGIQQAGSAMIGGITILLDAAAETAASAAAAGCLEEVPGVDVLMDVVGAAKVVKLVKQIHELATVWAKAWAVLQGLMGGVVATIGILQNDGVSASLPAAGYANAAEGLVPVAVDGMGGRR